jgi:hypothetical protein
MGSDVTRWLKACLECLLAKANKNLAHGMFRAVEFGQPGEAYGVDFYEVAMSECGMRIIMVIVDLFSRLTLFLPQRDRQAATIVRQLLAGARGVSARRFQSHGQ